MKQIFTRLVAASMMFALGILATAIPSYLDRRDVPAAPQAHAGARAEEEQVIAAVFRFQMEKHPGRALLPAYYLSCHNYADPPPRVMDYLRGAGLPAQPLSQLPSAEEGHYVDGLWWPRERFLLRVGQPVWVRDGEVVLGGAVRGRPHDEVSAYVYRVVREGGWWKVVAAETVS